MPGALTVRQLSVSYGAVPAVREVDLEVPEGEIRVILGANGAGKTSIIRAIMGLNRARAGSVAVFGSEVTKLAAHRVHRLGVAWVPEGRQLWSHLTVLENLRLGAFCVTDREAIRQSTDEMLNMFPRLRERAHQLAGSLSGGEQQMVAIARALMSRPRLLLMDEPSLGLAPMVVSEVFRRIVEINAAGATILLVEQNARKAMEIAHWVYLLENGRVKSEGEPKGFFASAHVQETFLGTGALATGVD